MGLDANDTKSPSQTSYDDEYVVEHSDIFRETTKTRNVYAACAHNMTQARPNDPDQQIFHVEVRKSGEIVSNLLTKLQVTFL
ncbi:hypothetical protein TNCT_173801 [Trichonephila clavata]|uniref:Uncharacterized protein n=1 Tax=Trichonephila clavata TaxID=2740835 RepID=A0A8X6G2L7_TRICU|nr:hypothetical protein TNCT_173801 [Trichonephila clavata]